ncbi:acyl carrier protein [Novispirillum itersonii]|uniref:Acyl carrier protein n=1 Tax=Novispirillum itersonii TaxID=189 RepID=A0A7W9ZL33_NOVIT|nr:acyl carrier protein [Novispirillum itersonii]MBB6212219.1 acyl carrier protein [Novispirillum itersonii]
MKSELLAIMAEFLEVDPEELQDYKTLEDLNIDSLDFVEIMFEVEEKYDAPVIFEMQKKRTQIQNLGEVLRLTEELILKHRDQTAASASPDARTGSAAPADADG